MSCLSKILDESILIDYLFCIGYMAGRADTAEVTLRSSVTEVLVVDWLITIDTVCLMDCFV